MSGMRAGLETSPQLVSEHDHQLRIAVQKKHPTQQGGQGHARQNSAGEQFARLQGYGARLFHV